MNWNPLRFARHVVMQLACIREELNTMSEALDRLTADVAAQETVQAGVVTLLQTLKTELDAAIASGDDDALNALSAKLEADTQTLSDAVTANTTPTAPVAVTDGGGNGNGPPTAQ